MLKRWITLFSRSGQEVWELSNKLQRIPDVIITNQADLTKIHSGLLSDLFKNRLVCINENTDETYKRLFNAADIITLHGYLKIIPAETCSKFNIYNGHPGLISVYPELRGYNPQIKACTRRDKLVGSVIHRCTEEVDQGSVCVERHYNITSEEINQYSGSLQNFYDNILRETSLNCWVEFFNNYINY